MYDLLKLLALPQEKSVIATALKFLSTTQMRLVSKQCSKDWRYSIQVIASELSRSELELTQLVAAKLNLEFVDKLECIKLNHLPADISLRALRQYAAVPFFGSSADCFVACLEPAQSYKLPASLSQYPRVLATWTSIAQALGRIERDYLVQLSQLEAQSLTDAEKDVLKKEVVNDCA